MLEARVELEAKNQGFGLPADMCKVGREGGGGGGECIPSSDIFQEYWFRCIDSF